VFSLSEKEILKYVIKNSLAFSQDVQDLIFKSFDEQPIELPPVTQEPQE